MPWRRFEPLSWAVWLGVVMGSTASVSENRFRSESECLMGLILFPLFLIGVGV